MNMPALWQRTYRGALVTLGVMLFLLGGSRFAYADPEISKEEVKGQASILVDSIVSCEGYVDDYAVDPIDPAALYLGDSLPVYDAASDVATLSDIGCWPVVQDGEVLATITTIPNTDGSTHFLFSTELVPDLNLCDGDVAIVNDGDAAQVLSESSSLFASEADCSLEGNCFGAIEFASVTNLEAIPLCSSELEAQAFASDDSIEALAASTLVQLSVPAGSTYTQVGVTCWAYATASAGCYLTNQFIAPMTLYNSNTLTGNDVIVGGFQAFQYSDGTRIASQIVSPPSDQQVMNWMSSGVPFVVVLDKVGFSPTHAVVVCGTNQYSGSGFVVTVMNPQAGAYQAMTKNYSGVLYLSYNYNNYTWTNCAVVPTGWQKPFGGTNWVYMNTTGTKHTGWLNLSNNRWYYLNLNTGYLAHSTWIQDGGYWYYLESDGLMARGWKQIGGTWYYLRTAKNTPTSGPDGAMLANGTWTINGKSYSFDSSGACLNP